MSKKVLITGPTSGTGKYLTEVLAGKDYELILVGRNKEKLEQLVETLNPAKSFIYSHDFSSSLGLKEVARTIHGDHKRIDILINNAGTLGNDNARITEEGWEQTFAVNYLSHYVLTSELLDLLQKGEGTLFNMCSQSISWYDLDFDDLQSVKAYKPMKAYGRSKLMLLMLGEWISENINEITVLNIDPGTFKSGISRSRGPGFRFMYNIAKGFMRSPDQACRDIVANLEFPDPQIPNGSFLRNGKIVNTGINKKDNSRLIEQSVNLTGSEIRNHLKI